MTENGRSSSKSKEENENDLDKEFLLHEIRSHLALFFIFGPQNELHKYGERDSMHHRPWRASRGGDVGLGIALARFYFFERYITKLKAVHWDL
jgi:hypothetical protein